VRQCKFCSRWFRNKQATRRHLGYCTLYLNAERTDPPWGREQLFQCAACRDTFGRDHAQRVTRDEMHESSSAYGGCPICQTNAWAPAGWRRVPPK